MSRSGVLDAGLGRASDAVDQPLRRAPAFSEIRRYASPREAQIAIDKQEVMIVVHIGQDFSRNLAANEPATVQILLDGRKSNSAQLVNGYVGTDRAPVRTTTAPRALPRAELVDRSGTTPIASTAPLWCRR